MRPYAALHPKRFFNGMQQRGLFEGPPWPVAGLGAMGCQRKRRVDAPWAPFKAVLPRTQRHLLFVSS